MDIKEIDILGDDTSHWYYDSKAAAIRSLLRIVSPREILDVGAGSGVFSRLLLRSSHGTSAVCVDTGYASDSAGVEAGKTIRFVRQIGKSGANVVLMIDVLEHVDDDVDFLRQYAGKVEPGCHFLLGVPAFQFLFSGHDVFLGHKRRYTIRSLERTAKAAGLTVIKSRYFFSAIFPLAAAVRLLGRSGAKSSLKRHSVTVNKLLALLHRLELPFLSINRMFGLTAFCLAQKPLAVVK
jgi:2-polyprenyl-3-methyl-5-hydroxy-6-metoxy-1,4-benzoquinol methylase